MDMEERVVLRKHDAKKKEEMSVQEGDIIRVDLKLKAPPGYIHALNIQTRIQGLIPAFKAKAFYNKTINMPLFGSDSPQDQVVGWSSLKIQGLLEWNQANIASLWQILKKSESVDESKRE